MVESVKDLGVFELDEKAENFLELLDVQLKEKLNLSLLQIKEALCKAIIDKAEEISLECPNIAPYGDYGKLLEDNDSMTDFLKKEASKPETLILHLIAVDEKLKQLFSFGFDSIAVEDLKGTVYVSKSGIIRHAYPRVEM